MIYFNFNLRNPWWSDRFANIKCWHRPTPIQNKYFEVQIIQNDNILRLELSYTIRQDHAGLNLELGLLGYEIHFTLYDNRHWDYNNNKWIN